VTYKRASIIRPVALGKFQKLQIQDFTGNCLQLTRKLTHSPSWIEIFPVQRLSNSSLHFDELINCLHLAISANETTFSPPYCCCFTFRSWLVFFELTLLQHFNSSTARASQSLDKLTPCIVFYSRIIQTSREVEN